MTRARTNAVTTTPSKKTTSGKKQSASIAVPSAPTRKAGSIASRPPRPPGAVTSQPKPTPKVEKGAGSKQANIIAVLRRAEGATVADLMQLTGWLPHSMRGVISDVLKRKLGLAVGSSLQPDRGRVYRIVDKESAPPAATSTPALRRAKAPPGKKLSSVAAPAA